MSHPFPRSVFHPAPLALAAWLGCAAVAAQTSAPPAGPEAAAAPAATRAALQEVTVSGRRDARTEGRGSYTAESAGTATRMELSIRETPQSISVVTRERMDDMGLGRIDQVLEQTTGVVVGQSDSERTRFSARGFSINNFQIDGMARGANAPLSDTVLYDRVEVLRGANGLMGGTGDPSATINMVRKRPAREFKGRAGLSLGRWNDRRAEVDLSAPLTADGRVRVRAALAGQDRDAYMDLYHERKTVGMVVLEADLAPATLFTAGLDFQRNRPTGATWGAVPYWNADGSLARLPRNFSLSTPWSTWARAQETAFTSLDHRFDGGWKLHLGYARTTSRVNRLVAYGGHGYPDPQTGGGISLWTGGGSEGRSVSNNYDLYATGPFQLLGRRHTLIAGWNGHQQTATSQGGDLHQPYPDAIPDYRTWTGNIPRPLFIPDGSSTREGTRLSGGYLAGRFNLLDPLSVIVGARLSNYRTGTRAYNSGGLYQGTRGVMAVQREITPYVGVVYDLNDQFSAYASYTTLFKPQSAKDRNERFLDPETGTAAELGVKGEFWGGRLNASAALFSVMKKNLAELDPSVPAGFTLPNGGSAYVANGEGITGRGFEFDVAGQITPAWNVNAGYTYLDATTAKGERAVTHQPRHLVRLSTAYRFSGALRGLKVGGGVSAQSATYGVSRKGPPGPVKQPNARIPQPAYAVFNLMAGYDIHKHVTAQLNINNLFDKKYYRNVGFYEGVFWAEPRNVTVSLRTTF